MAVLRIVVADDHAVVRQGIETWLEQVADFSVVGRAGDGLQTLDLVEQLEPDVLVLDISMPRLGGLDVVRRLHKSRPRMPIVMMSIHSTESHVNEALRSGASAYILKSSPPEELVSGIRAAAAGTLYLSPSLSERAAEVDTMEAPDLYETLTQRERDVLALIAQGSNNSAVATALCISPRTAEAHRAAVMRKLGLRGQHELTLYGVKRGLSSQDVEVDPPR